MLAELEHQHNGTPEELVQQLAVMFGMTAIDLSALSGRSGLTPAFDLLPLPLAQQWNCMLLRDADGILSGVLADPFDPDLQLWLNNQAHGTVLMRIASSADLRTCLTTWAPPEGSGSGYAPTGSAMVTRQPADEEATEQMLVATRELLKRVMRRS